MYFFFDVVFKEFTFLIIQTMRLRLKSPLKGDGIIPTYYSSEVEATTQNPLGYSCKMCITMFNGWEYICNKTNKEGFPGGSQINIREQNGTFLIANPLNISQPYKNALRSNQALTISVGRPPKFNTVLFVGRRRTSFFCVGTQQLYIKFENHFTLFKLV